MIINISHTWEKAKAAHNTYLENKIDKFLNHKGPIAKSKHSKNLVKWLKPYLISDKQNSLIHAIEKIKKQRKYLSSAELLLLNLDFEAIFDYHNFITKTVSWDAYQLCGLSTSKTCPYCHYNYTHTVVAEDGSYRPPLDHFYPKKKYPFLALTLINLIPSCHTCNSSLKKDSDFKTHPHLHPFFDDETINFHCKKDNLTILDIISNFEKIKNDLEINLRHPPTCEKTRNSITTFILKDSYKKFTQDAIEFIDSKTLLDNIPGLLEQFGLGPQLPGTALHLDTDARKILDRKLRFDRQKYKEKTLGKMYADLYDQFDRNTIFASTPP
ncbi:hypothetical protein [Pseudomonas sp. RT6P73]